MKLRLASASFFLAIILIMCLPCFSVKSFDYFSLVLMWPGAYCQQTNGGCCLPTTGEPAGDFLIKDLITYNSNGDSITKCQNINFDYNQGYRAGILKFYGGSALETCSEKAFSGCRGGSVRSS